MLAMYLKYRNIFGGNTKFSASIWRENYQNFSNVKCYSLLRAQTAFTEASEPTEIENLSDINKNFGP